MQAEISVGAKRRRHHIISFSVAAIGNHCHIIPNCVRFKKERIQLIKGIHSNIGYNST